MLHVAEIDVERGEDERERRRERQDEQDRERKVDEIRMQRRAAEHDRGDEEDRELHDEVEDRGADRCEREDLPRHVDLLHQAAVVDDRVGSGRDDLAVEAPRGQAGEHEDREVGDRPRGTEELADRHVVDQQLRRAVA